jgi:hypothetical protein
MAGTDDYSLDPLQVQEDELARQQAKILAQRLRAAQPVPLNDAYGQMMRTYSDVDSAYGEQDLKGKRAALSEQYQKQLADTLRKAGVSPQTSALVSNRSTQGVGNKALQEEVDMTIDDRERANRASRKAVANTAAGQPNSLGGGAVSGGDDYTYADALDDMQSINPRRQARGKAMYETMKPTDPTHITRVKPDGSTEVIPGAEEGLKRQIEAGARARDKVIKVDDNEGNEVQVSEQWYLDQLRRQARGMPNDIDKPLFGTGGVPGPGGTPATQGPASPAVTRPGPALPETVRNMPPAPQAGPPPQSALPQSTGQMPAGAPPVPQAPPPNVQSALPQSTGQTQPVSMAPSQGPTPPVAAGGTENAPILSLIPRLERYDPKNPVSPRGAQGPFQIMPDNVAVLSQRAGRQLNPMDPADGAYMADQILNDGKKRYGNNPEAVIAYYNGGRHAGDAVASGRRAPTEETRDYLERFQYLTSAGGSAGTGAPGSNVVAGPGGMPPAGPQGAKPGPEQFLDPTTQIKPVGNNPQLREQFKEQRNQQQMQMTKLAESNIHAGEVIKLLDQLDKVIDKPTYHSGTGQVLGTVGQNLAQLMPGQHESSPEYRNTQELEQVRMGLAIPLAKLLGVNPTESDVQNILKTFPQVSQDNQGRRTLYNNIVDQVKNRLQYIDFAQKAVNQGYTFSGAQQAFQKWQESLKQAPENPTPAGGSQPAAPAAVPSSVSSAAAAPPPPGAPPSALPSSVAAAGGSTPPGGQNPHLNTPWQEVKQIGSGLVDSAMSLPKALFASKGDSPEGIPIATPFGVMTTPSTKGTDAFKDSAGNFVEGAKELAGYGDRPAAMKEIARQEERARNDPEYAQAKIFSDITGVPTSYIPGTTIAKIVAAGVAQGILNPAADLQTQIENGLKAGLFAGVLGGASKALPSKAITPEMKAATAEFPSVHPTAAQLSPGSLESKLAAGLGLNDAAALNQVKALTKDMSAKAGIEGETVTIKSVADADKTLTDGYNKLFAEKQGALPVKIRLSTVDQKAIKDSLDNFTRVPGSAEAVSGPAGPQGVQKIMTDELAPNLNKIYQAFTGTNPVNLSPKVLHEAWKEVSLVSKNGEAAGAVRAVLEDIISKGMKPDSLAAFKELNKKYGNLQDIQRVMEAGGAGKGSAAGYLQPSKIEALAKESMAPNSDIKKALELINQMHLRDVREGIISPSIASTASNVVRAGRQLVGKPLQWADQASQFVGTIPGVGYLADALRRHVPQVKPGIDQAVQENQNAP